MRATDLVDAADGVKVGYVRGRCADRVIPMYWIALSLQVCCWPGYMAKVTRPIQQLLGDVYTFLLHPGVALPGTHQAEKINLLHS